MALEIKENILLAPYTLYKIGGSARFYAETASADDVAEALYFAAERKLPFVIIGAGSNILVSDGGFDGLAIRMVGGGVRLEGDRLICDAGVMMARAVLGAAKAGLGGFEWGIGIPGTIGGSVRGNAGCFGREMKDVVESVEVFEVFQNSLPEAGQPSAEKFRVNTLRNFECDFTYRSSVFKKHQERIILSATLRLQPGDAAAIQQEVRRITEERLAKQDIGTKCCGCIFKNTAWGREDTDKDELTGKFPEFEMFRNQPALPTSFLLDRAGLKGARVGGAVVSPKHANFFINEGAASAKDIAALIMLGKEKVREKFGVLIEEEIQYIGSD